MYFCVIRFMGFPLSRLCLALFGGRKLEMLFGNIKNSIILIICVFVCICDTIHCLLPSFLRHFIVFHPHNTLRLMKFSIYMDIQYHLFSSWSGINKGMEILSSICFSSLLLSISVISYMLDVKLLDSCCRC